MFRGHSIAVVLPAYNEEKFVAAVIRGLPPLVDHVILVDDCSTDQTVPVATALADSRLVVLRTPANSGVGGAMALGYQKALELGAEIVVKMDADGQMLPEYLPALLEPVVSGRVDYAKGNRFLTTSALSVMPRRRLFANVILTFLTKAASGYWHVFDPQNGYTALRGTRLARLNLDKLARGYFFENDMLSQLYLQAAKVEDVDIPARYADEESKIRYFRIMVAFPLLFFLRFLRRIYQKYILRDFSPVALFLIVGFLLFGWGAAFGTYLWIRSAVTLEATPTGTIMLSLLPLILGFQLLLQGVVLDIHETPR